MLVDLEMEDTRITVEHDENDVYTLRVTDVGEGSYTEHYLNVVSMAKLAGMLEAVIQNYKR